MAARRLLIVMLVLLGLSTLAAALIPQRSLRDRGTTGATTTQPTPATPAKSTPPGQFFPIKITVGGNQVPLVTCPSGERRSGGCRPIRVGDQLSLAIRSRQPAQLEIPQFGLVGVATPDSPALFDLIPDTAGTFGILFASSHKVAARITVIPAAGRGAEKTKPKERR